MPSLVPPSMFGSPNNGGEATTPTRPLSATPKLQLGTLHKRRASASPEKFGKNKFEPLPLMLETSNLSSTNDRSSKRTRYENKVDIEIDVNGTPHVSAITPTLALPSGRKVSGETIRNPTIVQSSGNFGLIDSLVKDHDILLKFVSYLPIPALLSLYAISKLFHYRFNGAYCAFIVASMQTWAPGSDVLYPWRSYKDLCIKDPRLRQKSVWQGHQPKKQYEDLRDTPSLRWLQMVIWRHGVCKDMLIQLATKGLRCPEGTLDAVQRMWYIMDLPLNAQRIALCRTAAYINNETIAKATHFFLKIDMAFTDPVGRLFPPNRPGANLKVHRPQWANCGFTGCSLRGLLLAEKGLTPLWRALRGWCTDPREPTLPLNRLDMLNLFVRHRYRLPQSASEEVKRQSIMGVPWHEVGTASLERTAVSLISNSQGSKTAVTNPALASNTLQHTYAGRQLMYPHKKQLIMATQKPREVLLRPEELMMREAVRRQMQLHKQWARMLLWGFCDAMGTNHPVYTEEEMLESFRKGKPVLKW